uniref:Uncharacterized protein n=1 Tax=Anguilla anguilla TaxID=7936 RepID=A0A0E9SV96_ANGAN
MVFELFPASDYMKLVNKNRELVFHPPVSDGKQYFLDL